MNPRLWRVAQLNKAYDLSVMSIIEGEIGYMIVDPLTCKETAKAAIDLVYEHLSKKPINAFDLWSEIVKQANCAYILIIVQLK